MDSSAKTLSLTEVLKGISSIDIYITYRCNLRCKHCFVGDYLDTKTDFDLGLHNKLIDSAKESGIKEITYLGGEPTLYKYIIEAINYTFDSGLKVRIVTNGGIGLERLMNELSPSKMPHCCLSIDGASINTHDKIRGKGSLEALIDNSKKYRELGGKLSAIASIDLSNYHEVPEIIKLAENLHAEYLNIHYISQRGFANESQVLSISQWESVVLKIISASKNVNIPIRFEKTFLSSIEYQPSCLVKEKRNIMFFPDGKVYRCAMFIDMPNSHSYNYNDKGVFYNLSPTSEESICKNDSELGCPAALSVYGKNCGLAKEEDKKVGCVYTKTCVIDGEIQNDFRMH